ncbi:coniferyl-alcohol dehydrogenase [Cupriavidus sp. WS]|uniref:coniferyl-alcohol dehydrogenase n=1 Tax=Cupriavidus sp. WS TaxID=1312922 RepID=UPI00036E38B6|nr:coniferyl-alcohol dehydrogenase [Cupriavidus sp. WS]
MKFADKAVVVTGAASGIGAACAAYFKAAGAHVIGVDRNAVPGNGVDQFVQADLSDPASIAAAAARIERADALCNIAGLPPTRGTVPVLQVNFTGLRLFTEALLPRLNNGAAIVNLASLAGFGWHQDAAQALALLEVRQPEDVPAFCASHGVDDARAYFLSKEALVVWTLQCRWRWRERGIRMNAVSPGPVETPIHQDFLKTLGERAEEDMRLMERAGRPADIAPLVAFLCSDESAWIRGANIPCDGGMEAHVLSGIHRLG